jgi:GH15 family glucan-1,4-alpha-glucosidase
MYTLRGEPDLPRENLPFAGYRGSRPVRVGNDAEDQLQMGSYADILDAAYRFCGAGHILDPRTMERCAELADEVCRIWREADGGIWEIDPQEYTESRIACWGALDHAIELEAKGRLPGDSVKEWKRERGAIREWVESECWSESRGAYVMYPGSDSLDASLLLGARFGFFEPADERFAATIAAIREELGAGPFLYRTTDLKGEEGCFLACSFWLVDALARCGRIDEARALMEELLGAANDAGLYSEQIDPATGAFLGNTPQALTHLSLILAAVSVMRAERAQLRER